MRSAHGFAWCATYTVEVSLCPHLLVPKHARRPRIASSDICNQPCNSDLCHNEDKSHCIGNLLRDNRCQTRSILLCVDHTPFLRLKTGSHSLALRLWAAQLSLRPRRVPRWLNKSITRKACGQMQMCGPLLTSRWSSSPRVVAATASVLCPPIPHAREQSAREPRSWRREEALRTGTWGYLDRYRVPRYRRAETAIVKLLPCWYRGTVRTGRAAPQWAELAAWMPPRSARRTTQRRPPRPPPHRHSMSLCGCCCTRMRIMCASCIRWRLQPGTLSRHARWRESARSQGPKKRNGSPHPSRSPLRLHERHRLTRRMRLL